MLRKSTTAALLASAVLAAACNVHLAMRAEVIDNQVLEMIVRKLLHVMLEETNQTVLPERLGQTLHRNNRHARLLSSLEVKLSSGLKAVLLERRCY